MEFLKELFTEPLTFEDFAKAVAGKGYKLADLSKGEYVAKGKLDEQANKVKSLNSKIAEYENKINELQTNNQTAEQYKNELDKLKQQIADEKEAAELEAKEAEFKNRFEKVAEGKAFAHDYIKNGVLEDFKKALSDEANKGKGDSEIFELLTKDKVGIFASQNPPGDMAGMGQIDSGQINEDKLRAVMGLPQK